MTVIAISVGNELLEALNELANSLEMSRSALIRRLLQSVLQDQEGIERLKDAILGPRFTFNEK